MYKLKDLLEQRNVSKINYGNAPKKLFTFAYTNGGRAFTVKTIRPSTPNILNDVIKTISSSNTIGASSTYGKDHVFIISNDLKKNANKDVRNVVVIPIEKFQSMTSSAFDKENNPINFDDATVLDKPISLIGQSPVIYWSEFEKAVAQFKEWLADSEETRALKQKLADLENKLKNAANQDATGDESEEEDDEVEIQGGEDPEVKPDKEEERVLEFTKLDEPTKTVTYNVQQLRDMSNKDVTTTDKNSIYIYQKLLEGFAKTTVGDLNTWETAVNFLKAGGADGDWGKASKSYLADLQNTLTELSDGPVLSKLANITPGKENVYWSKELMDQAIRAIDQKQLPGLEWKWIVKNESIIKLKSLIEQIFVDSNAVKKIKKINDVPTSNNLKKKDNITQDPIKQDPIKKDPIKQDPIKQDTSYAKLVRTPNGFLWASNATIPGTKYYGNGENFRKVYSFPKLDKLVKGRSIQIRAKRALDYGVGMGSELLRFQPYKEVSSYWLNDNGSIDSGMLRRNRCDWAFYNVKVSDNLAATIVKSVSVTFYKGNDTSKNLNASYFYIKTKNGKYGWIPSTWVNVI